MKNRLLLLPASLVALAGCADGHLHDGVHQAPPEELEYVGLPVTCAASLEHYPVGGPHNGGWDPDALDYQCYPFPNGNRNNSDFIAGDHFGNDLFAALGTPAIAPVSGTISHSGYGSVSGNRVTIEDSCGWHYFSGHLDTIAPGMTVGTYVTAGEVIGTVGNTGNAVGTSPHIHFTIYPETWNAAIDPYPLLSGVEAGACTGEAGIGPGETPSPAVNPCTDADLQFDDTDGAFALVYGSEAVATETGGGLGGGGFLAQQAYGADVAYTVGKWQPYVSHSGLWAVDVYVPGTALPKTSQAMYDVAFHGGRVVDAVDQSAETGWVPLFDGEPLKFLEGVHGYVGLSNLGSVGSGGWVTFDAARWRYIGPAGAQISGGECTLSADCQGNLVCGESGLCEASCFQSGCSDGSCDQATGVCVLPDDEGDDWDGGDELVDTDGDGIPNYLEGMDDADGDGAPNQWDPDADGDGVPDAMEGAADLDGDGIPNNLDLDSDGDGLSDADEYGDFELPLDTDLDGIPDFQDTDSDGDGIPDAQEIGHPEDIADTDHDGVPDHLDTDSDGDGIPDAVEVDYEPESPLDTDGDGTPDHLDSDSDNDGLDDSWEGNDDSDGDGIPDFRDLDSDDDGIPDAEDADSDGDGVDDLQTLPEGNAFGGDAYGCTGCSAGGSSAGWLLLPLIGLVRRRRSA